MHQEMNKWAGCLDKYPGMRWQSIEQPANRLNTLAQS